MSNDEEASEGEQGASFALLKAQSVGFGAKCCALCSAMDLAAVVSDDGRLLVYRCVEWQLTFALGFKDEDQGTASCVAWHPQGRFLVVGTTKGWLITVDVELGEATHPQTQPHTSQLVAVSWTALDTPQLASHINDFLPLLDPPPSPPPAPSPALLSFPTTLVSMDSTLQVHVSVCGVFPVVTVSAWAFVQPQQPQQPQQQCQASGSVVATPSLSHIGVLVSDKGQASVGCKAVSIASPLLARNSGVLCQLALVCTSLRGLLAHYSWAVTEAHDIWKNTLEAHSKAMSRIAPPSFGGTPPPSSPSSVETQLCAMVAHGKPGAELETVIAKHFAPKAVEAMRQGLREAWEKMHAVVASHLVPCAERLCFRARELAALGEWEGRTASLGLSSPSLANELLRECYRLQALHSSLSKHVEEEAWLLGAFFDWLLGMSKVVAEHDDVEGNACVDYAVVVKAVQSGLLRGDSQVLRMLKGGKQGGPVPRKQPRSLSSLHALLAAWPQADVHATDANDFPTCVEALSQHLGAAESTIQRTLATSLRPLGCVDVALEAKQAKAADVVVSEIVQVGADLVVVGVDATSGAVVRVSLSQAFQYPRPCFGLSLLNGDTLVMCSQEHESDEYELEVVTIEEGASLVTVKARKLTSAASNPSAFVVASQHARGTALVFAEHPRRVEVFDLDGEDDNDEEDEDEDEEIGDGEGAAGDAAAKGAGEDESFGFDSHTSINNENQSVPGSQAHTSANSDLSFALRAPPLQEVSSISLHDDDAGASPQGEGEGEGEGESSAMVEDSAVSMQEASAVSMHEASAVSGRDVNDSMEMSMEDSEAGSDSDE